MSSSNAPRGWVSVAVEPFRRRRMQRLFSLFRIGPSTRVLDVGGTPYNWLLAPSLPKVTLLNLPRALERSAAPLEWVFASGCQIPFGDRCFDVVFCNSVIEHLPSAEDRSKLASEIRRVGRAYWVQTPFRGFPVEPHLCTPFLHYLPRSWQRWIVRRFTVWEWLEKPESDRRDYYLEHYLSCVRLLGLGEMKELFPDARILRERFLGLTKSLIAVRLPES